ncbi:hypothetical protein MMC16_002088 [Acarospora aff. strigata]|nr:hypothetical protein [Acarospora aff. strigata]
MYFVYSPTPSANPAALKLRVQRQQHPFTLLRLALPLHRVQNATGRADAAGDRGWGSEPGGKGMGGANNEHGRGFLAIRLKGAVAVPTTREIVL